MAEMVTIRFAGGLPIETYQAVNDALEMDLTNVHAGDVPDGLIAHVAAIEGDDFVVREVWESQAQQGTFMAERLGPAFGKVGVPEPASVAWTAVVGYFAG